MEDSVLIRSYFDENSAAPRQLTSILGSFNGTNNPTFTYGANGNMTGGANRSFSWTSSVNASTGYPLQHADRFVGAFARVLRIAEHAGAQKRRTLHKLRREVVGMADGP